jgi:class 3 adenylate cyclase/tetratricopeptide (TPR) repeat protein
MANSVIALVFTDVVGSSAAKRDAHLGTSVSVRDKAYLEAIQSKHMRVVRSAVAEHNGKEILTIGDSFFLTFDEPLDALRCCAAIQQRLVDQPIDTMHGPLRLRIGIHVGTPEYFEGSWHGTDVDIASRAESAATARQIIVTHAARQLLGEPMGVKFRPLGTYALKGVGNIKLWDADYDYHGLRPAAFKSNEQKNRRRLGIAAVVLAILLPILALGGWYGWKNHDVTVIAAATGNPPTGTPNSIIVADFDNKTGEPVFDNTLTQAFIIQLQQSPVITVVSPQHLRQSMKYLGKSPDDPMTPALAQDLGVREGDKAYVTGTIAKLGDEYLITVTAVNPANGDSIASAQGQAHDKDHVLDALSRVATGIRNKLGESLDSIQRLDTPLGQGTTPSLDAFRAFALGDVDHYAGREVPFAEEHYKQALEIDPNFAVAWARLGTTYINSGQISKALDCYTHAFKLEKNTSELERWYIETKYYGTVVGDVPKTIDILQLACQTYPLDWGSRLNLGTAEAGLGRIEEGFANVQMALKQAPDSALANTAAIGGYIAFDRYAEAQAAADSYAKNHPVDVLNNLLYYLHVLINNPSAAAEDVARARGRDDEYQMTGAIATAQEFQGKYAAADATWKLAASQAAAQGATDVQANFLLARIVGRSFVGLAKDPGTEIKAALDLDRSKNPLGSAAAAAAITNQPELAQSFLAELTREYPQDTIINQVLAPSVRGALKLGAHQPKEALQEMEGRESYDSVASISYFQGLAYLELHDGGRAVAAFKRVTRYRGLALTNGLQDYGPGQLELARAYVMAGDRASARRTYQDLFMTWKDADPDLPPLVEAKKEYAALELTP